MLQESLSKSPIPIFSYYPVENEVALLNKQRKLGVPNEALIWYIERNVFSFLHEFVEHKQEDSVHYYFGDDKRMHFVGIHFPVDDMYAERGREQGANSREEAESQGFSQIERVLAENKADFAFWISPPSWDVEGFGAYGFMFVFEKIQNTVVTHVLRYDDEDRMFSKSTMLYEMLFAQGQLNDKNTAIHLTDEKSFLRNPVFVKNSPLQNTQKTYRDIVSALGFPKQDSPADRVDSDIFIKSWLAEYETLVLSLSGLEPHEQPFQLIAQAKQRLTAIYNRAQRLFLKKDTEAIQQSAYAYGDNVMQAFFAAYTSREAVVVGGGSCPSNNKAGHPFFQSIIDVIMNESKGILNYHTADKILKRESEENTFECPACHQHIESGKGIITCPHCGMTAEKWAKLHSDDTCLSAS